MRSEARIDLAAITANTRRLDELAGAAGVMAVVKADGYGHGLVPQRRAVLAGGAAWLGVAFLEEALGLRAAGIEAPVLAWLSSPQEDLAPAVAAGVDLGIYDLAELRRAAEAAARTGRTARVHLKVDTGLSRGGATVEDWPGLCAQAARTDGVEVVGVWSHFAFADGGPDHPVNCGSRRSSPRRWRSRRGRACVPQVRHLANSAATLTAPATHYDLVRPGVALYGLSPVPQLGSPADLRPAARDDARRPRGAGQAGAGGAGRELPAPLHDRARDDPRAGAARLRRRGAARRHQRRCRCSSAGGAAPSPGPSAWTSSSSTSATTPVSAGDEVLLFGPGDDGEPTAQEWADVLGTIDYEVVTRVGARVPRTYA